MSYTTDPVLDASRHYDALYDREDRMQAGEKAARAEIADTLTRALRTVPAKALTLPAISYRNGMRLIRVGVADTVSDRVPYGKPLESLLLALQLSDCPHVAALRKALADDYADSHADEIGMAMGDDE